MRSKSNQRRNPARLGGPPERTTSERDTGARRRRSESDSVEALHAELRRAHRRIDRLQQRNRELDEFARMATHDLKEPLGGIRAHCELLEAVHGDQLGQTGRWRVEKIVGQCDRMERQIVDLLAYSRLANHALRLSDVHLGTLVGGIVDDLRHLLDQSGGRILTEDPLPVIRADEELVRSALQNLITNGLKFNRCADPTVIVGCQPTKPATIFVRDNGIGIPEQFHDQVFDAFRRLHPQRDFPGTGVGLSTVRKVVEAHRGTIRVESKPGQGTTFLFTLAPQRERRANKMAAPHFATRCAADKDRGATNQDAEAKHAASE